MKMDRNVNSSGIGKYVLLKLRRYRELMDDRSMPPHKKAAIKDAMNLLRHHGILDDSHKGSEGEFMVFRLKDKYVYHAIEAYAAAAHADGETEWADECYEMLERAGRNSPWCKKPD